MAATEPITINVDPEVARMYRNATPKERLKLEVLFSVQVRSLSQMPARSLKEVMDEISQRAQERGLTQEILEEILRDE